MLLQLHYHEITGADLFRQRRKPSNESHMKHANRHIVIAISLIIGFVAGETATAAPAGKMPDSITVLTVRLQSLKPELFDTPQAKEFMTTGKNPYIGKQEAIDKGKKLFQLYSCVQCHGGDAQGQIAPGLHGPDFKYAQNASN